MRTFFLAFDTRSRAAIKCELYKEDVPRVNPQKFLAAVRYLLVLKNATHAQLLDSKYNPLVRRVRSGNVKCNRRKGYETNQDDMAAAPDRVAILLPLGVAVTMAFSTVIIQALALMAIMRFVRHELRLGRAGVEFWWDVGIIVGATLVALAAHVVAIASWGLVFSLCGEFSQLAKAVYHSGMNYTTLGDSENLMSPPWRLLAPLEAANGMLMFGISTAMLFAIVLRLIQAKFSELSSHSVNQGRRGKAS